jgi:hypothetical protein
MTVHAPHCISVSVRARTSLRDRHYERSEAIQPRRQNFDETPGRDACRIPVCSTR